MVSWHYRQRTAQMEGGLYQLLQRSGKSYKLSWRGMLSARNVGNGVKRFEPRQELTSRVVARLRPTSLNRYCMNCFGFRAASFNLLQTGPLRDR